MNRILNGQALIIVSMLFAHLAPGQTVIIPPSPNAEAFAKYGNIPVSTYTGVPDIQIPLYEIKSRDISVPISLGYHASGIKVSEEASRVGLGWVLNCGGIISRNIVNRDDFFNDVTAWVHPQNISPAITDGPNAAPAFNVQAGTILSMYYRETGSSTAPVGDPDGYWGQYIDEYLPKVSHDLTNFIYGSNVDYEPDHFAFQIPGKSGKFVLGRGGIAVLEKQDQIDITFTRNTNSVIWFIQTATGFKFTFNASEYFVDPGASGGAQQTSAWYLTEILSPTGEKVTFQYTTLPQAFIKPAGQYQESITAFQFSCGPFACTPVPDKRSTLPRKTYSNIYLSRILWSNGKVEFEMEPRDDLEGDLRVKQMNVFARTLHGTQELFTLHHAFKFNYSYFDKTVSSSGFTMVDVTPERLRKRLKLESVDKLSASLAFDSRYRFGYYETENAHQLPPKNSFARDHWGYYNGRHDNTAMTPSFRQVINAASYADLSGIMGEERNPSADHAKAFALREIVYPTQGKTVLQYGLNDYELTTDDKRAPVVFKAYNQFLYDAVASRGVLKSSPLDLRDQFANTMGKCIPIEVAAAFRSNKTCEQLTGFANIYFEITSETGAMQLAKVSVNLDRCTDPGQLDCIACDPNGPVGVFTYRGQLTLPQGKYLWRAFAAPDESRFQDISVTLTWYADSRLRSPLGPDKKFAHTGGLRIERIEDHDPVTGQVANVRRFDYHYFADTNGDGKMEEHSTGKRTAVPEYTTFDVQWEKRKLTDDEYSTVDISYTCTDCLSIRRHSNSAGPLTGVEGNTVGYDKVVEILGQNGENGRIEYLYENHPDYDVPYAYPHGSKGYVLRPPLISTRRNPMNGLLISKTSFSAKGLRVHALTNTFDYRDTRIVYGLEVRRIPAINFDITDYASAYAAFGPRADVLMLTYPAIISLFQYQAFTVETLFDAAGQPRLTQTTSNAYESSKHHMLTQTTHETSDGGKILTTYTYPADYTDAASYGALIDMKRKRFDAFPVETKVSQVDANGVMHVLDHSINEYKMVGNFGVLASQVKLLNDLPQMSTPEYVPASGYDQSRYQRMFSLSYSAEGNVSAIEKPANVPVSYLWGYNKSLPVAEVTNAAPTECFFENFEETGTGSIFVAHAGRKYFTGDYEVKFLLPNSRNYWIEYWYYENGEWKYASKAYNGPMWLTEGSAIDDVRIYPRDAFMKSFTYDPLSGMTSAIDENGRVSRFEYDPVGRLSVIRNDRGEIVKHYSYRFRTD